MRPLMAALGRALRRWWPLQRRRQAQRQAEARRMRAEARRARRQARNRRIAARGGIRFMDH